MPRARQQQARGRRPLTRRPLLPPPLLPLVAATAILLMLATTTRRASAADAANATAAPAAAAAADADASPLLPPMGAEPPGVVFGTVQVVAVHGPMVPGTTVEHQHQLFIRVRGSGEMRRLLFPSPAPERAPPTGSLVMVKTAALGTCLRPGAPPVDGNPVCVKSMMAHESGSPDGFAHGQPRGEVSLKTIVFALDVCGSGPAAAPSQIERVLFSDAPDAFPYTVQGMMRACSYGAANFSRALGSAVERRVVPIPCSGYTPSGVFYDSKTCPFNEWSDVANKYIRDTLGIRLEDYKHKVYVTPSGGLCQWGGMGYVGCVGDCRVWVSGDVWDRAATYAHELGHNLFLNHAGARGDGGYGDFSATMGYCCDVRCYNPPHLWQMGWATALAPALTAATFPAGTWVRHALPAQITTSRNYLRVRPDWAGGGGLGSAPAAVAGEVAETTKAAVAGASAAAAATAAAETTAAATAATAAAETTATAAAAVGAQSYNLYFSYRKRLGYDAGMSVSRGFADKVSVYSARAGDPQPFTSHEGAVAPGETWRETRLGSGLVVVFSSAEGNAADVALCRPSPGQEARETDCADGLDNDCDGLVDGQDAGDCGAGGTAGGGGGGGGGAPQGPAPAPPAGAGGQQRQAGEGGGGAQQPWSWW